MKLTSIASALRVKSFPLNTLISSTIMIGTIALPSKADITSYDLIKGYLFRQSSNTVTDFSSASFGSYLVGDVGDFSGVIATYNGSLSPLNHNVDISDLPDENGNFSLEATYFIEYGTKSELDANFPDGSTYTFEVNGGTLGSQTITVNTPATSPFFVPSLSGNTFSQLQKLDPTQPFTLTWEGFTPEPEWSGAIDFAVFVSGGGRELPVNKTFSPTTTSFILPANTLAANQNYGFALYYRSFIVDPLNPESSVQVRSGTGGSFSTKSGLTQVPESSSLWGFGFLAGLGILQWTRRKIA